MQASKLQLETYHLNRISVIPRPDAQATALGQYADFSNVMFGSDVSLQELKAIDGPDVRQGLSLKLTAQPGEGSTFPYDIEMEMLGVFNADGFPEADRDVMLLVNGASMLYGAMREMLMTITYRCMHGPVLLPSVHFVELEKDYREKQAKLVAAGGEQEAKGAI